MNHIKLTRNLFIVTLGTLSFVKSAFSRPPVDQILLPPARERGVKILRNSNITYTNEQPEEKGKNAQIKTLYKVKGRSRPDRTGKILSLLEKESVVTPFKLSKDKKWIAVIVQSSSVRVWVPLSALPALDKNLKLDKVLSSTKDEE